MPEFTRIRGHETAFHRFTIGRRQAAVVSDGPLHLTPPAEVFTTLAPDVIEAARSRLQGRAVRAPRCTASFGGSAAMNAHTTLFPPPDTPVEPVVEPANEIMPPQDPGASASGELRTLRSRA
jgi:hypothetical protein